MWQDAQSAESRFAWIVQFTRAIRNVAFASDSTADIRGLFSQESPYPAGNGHRSAFH